MSKQPAPVNQITISPVYISEPSLLTREQKFRGGFVCNLPIEKKPLLERAAADLHVEIEFTAPRQRDPKEFVGVQTDIAKCDPQTLLDRYYALNIAQSQSTNLPETKPVRRRRPAKRKSVAARVPAAT